MSNVPVIILPAFLFCYYVTKKVSPGCLTFSPTVFICIRLYYFSVEEKRMKYRQSQKVVSNVIWFCDYRLNFSHNDFAKGRTGYLGRSKIKTDACTK